MFAVQLGFVVCAVIGGVVLYKVFQGSSVEGAIRDTKGSLKGGFKEAKGSARVRLVSLFCLLCAMSPTSADSPPICRAQSMRSRGHEAACKQDPAVWVV